MWSCVVSVWWFDLCCWLLLVGVVVGVVVGVFVGVLFGGVFV